MLVVSGVRIATRAWVATDPRGVRHFVFDVRSLYRRPAAEPSARERFMRGRPRPKAREVELAEPGRFWASAYAAGLGDASDAMLASFGEEALRRLMYRMTVRDWGNTGECQLCANIQKLKVAGIPGTRVMVDHGYHYPDSDHWRGGILGQREGSCEAVGFAPYEKSCDFLRNVILPRQEEWLANAERAVEDAAGAIRSGQMMVPARWIDRFAPENAPNVLVERGSRDWKRAANLLMATVVDDRERVEGYIAWLKKRIERWRPRPLYDELNAEGRAAFERGDGDVLT